MFIQVLSRFRFRAMTRVLTEKCLTFYRFNFNRAFIIKSPDNDSPKISIGTLSKENDLRISDKVGESVWMVF